MREWWASLWTGVGGFELLKLLKADTTVLVFSSVSSAERTLRGNPC
ncbi:MAG: hypothetical protein ACTSYM_03270 [Candidatus Baldrarchaeia archaeon]